MRLIVLALGVALASPALAADTPEAAPADSKDKVICRKERPTGSRIPEKICMTKAQWEAATDATQDALRARGADRGMLDNRQANPGAN